MTSTTSPTTAQTAVLTMTALVGTGLLVAARPVLRALGDDGPAAVTTARVLGSRYLVQAAVCAVRPRTLTAVPAVELLHAASMLPLAASSRRHRTPALVSAAIAVGVALSSWSVNRRGPRVAGRHRTSQTG